LKRQSVIAIVTRKTMKTRILTFAVLAASVLAASAALADPPAPGTVHVRGTIQSLKGGVLTVKSGSGPVLVQLPAKTPVVSVVPSDRKDVKEGSFLGIASVAVKGGARQAREVVVFPEAARGTGEGNYDWDLPEAGASKMTNGTASHSHMTNGAVTHSRMTNGTARMTNGTATGSRMTNGTVKGGGTSYITLEFKDGSGKGTQKLTLPAGIPFVTFTAGQMSQLVPGAHVVVFGRSGAHGAVAAERVLVGKDGLVPPM
jgi:hypothetical protein